MKIQKPIRLFIPASILNVINEKVKRNKENYIYIIHYILCKPLRDKRFENSDFSPINKKKLESVLICNSYRYIKFLEKYELIENDKTYINGKKSFYYRIHAKHKFDCNYFELMPETNLYNNIVKNIKNEKTNYSKFEPHLSKMAKEFMNLQYDFEGALNWINTIQDDKLKISYLISINQLADARFRYFKRNNTNNRLDTNLTNIKKELRQFIVGDFVSIDTANSQPFLLWFLFEKIAKILNFFHLKKLKINQNTIDEILSIKHIPLCLQNDLSDLVKIFGIQSFKTLLLVRKKNEISFFTNLSLFKKLVSQGIFYDEFVKEFEEQITRDVVKDIMFKVLFSQNRMTGNFFVPYADEKKIFAKVFPIINEMIEALKEKKHNLLAIYLQKLESNLFIDCIAKRLVENGIIPYTIHDSIIIPTNQQEKALNIVKSVFKNEIGTIPVFHIEPLKK